MTDTETKPTLDREALVRVLAKADGLNWDEECGYERVAVEDGACCDSPTCVAAYYEDHVPEIARRDYYRRTDAVLALIAEAVEAPEAKTDLQALSDAATAGPWEACDLGDYGDYDGKCRVILGDDKRIVVVLHGGNEANRRECDATIEYIVALVNAHREGRLVERGSLADGDDE